MRNGERGRREGGAAYQLAPALHSTSSKCGLPASAAAPSRCALAAAALLVILHCVHVCVAVCVVVVLHRAKGAKQTRPGQRNANASPHFQKASLARPLRLHSDTRAAAAAHASGTGLAATQCCGVEGENAGVECKGGHGRRARRRRAWRQ